MSARAILLGFDGLDPRLCRRWMESGHLPNLKRLAGSGDFRDLHTSIPCQSPVAWRTLITGANPGVHGIFDFLRRLPGSYLPDMSAVARGALPVAGDGLRYGLSAGVGALGAFAACGLAARLRIDRRKFLAGCLGLPLAGAALAALEAWVPREVPMPVNRTSGEPFWATLGKAGVRTTALRMPVEFPPREYPNARVLAGLGVPDLRATNGTYTIFAADAQRDADTEMGGRIVPLAFSGQEARAEILGPPNPMAPEDDPLKLPLSLRRDGGDCVLSWPNGSTRLKAGQWSEWIDFAFAADPWVKVNGKGRFHLLSSGPEVRIYLTPIEFDASRLPPNVRLTAPAGYAAELAGRCGFFKTLGWPTDTWSLNEEHVPDEVYQEDYRETMRMEKALTLTELARKDWDCFAAVFTPTDQIQHVFAPREGDTGRGENAILAAYREADDFVGTVMKEHGHEDATLMVLSDHGFHPFRKAVHLNTWLWRNGYLKFKGEVRPEAPERKMLDLYRHGNLWEGVDWRNTYAYSMGLGNVLDSRKFSERDYAFGS